MWIKSNEYVMYIHIHTYILIHDHSPTGLFRASAAQQDWPNACEGTSGCRQMVMDDPGAQQPSHMFFDLGKGQATTPGTPCTTLYK